MRLTSLHGEERRPFISALILKVVGVVEVDFQNGEQQATLNLVIVDGKGPPLLGNAFLAGGNSVKLGVVPQGQCGDQ